jgi:hypothetical protein
MASQIKPDSIPLHPLQSEWNYFLHLHDNKDWSLKSYIKMASVNTVQHAILLNDEIHYDLIKKSMMFLMKTGINPMWEDEHNKHGGCFSFKVPNKDIEQVWKRVYFHLIGCNLTKDIEIYKHINGITLSPKKKFCILKVWMNTCQYKDTDIFNKIDNLDFQGCLFKKHCPEY